MSHKGRNRSMLASLNEDCEKNSTLTYVSYGNFVHGHVSVSNDTYMK